MVVLCCIVVVTGFLPFPVSRSSLSSPPSQVLLSKHCFRGLRQERMEKQIDDTRAREKSQRDSQREMQVLGPAKGTRALNFVLC